MKFFLSFILVAVVFFGCYSTDGVKYEEICNLQYSISYHTLSYKNHYLYYGSIDDMDSTKIVCYNVDSKKTIWAIPVEFMPINKGIFVDDSTLIIASKNIYFINQSSRFFVSENVEWCNNELLFYNGKIIVQDKSSRTIKFLDLKGNLIDTISTHTSASFPISIDSIGNLYFIQTVNNVECLVSYNIGSKSINWTFSPTNINNLFLNFKVINDVVYLLEKNMMDVNQSNIKLLNAHNGNIKFDSSPLKINDFEFQIVQSHGNVIIKGFESIFILSLDKVFSIKDINLHNKIIGNLVTCKDLLFVKTNENIVYVYNNDYEMVQKITIDENMHNSSGLFLIDDKVCFEHDKKIYNIIIPASAFYDKSQEN